MPDAREISRTDIDEIKADLKLVLVEMRAQGEKFIIHVAEQKSLEYSVVKLNNTIYGDGTPSNPGHVAETDKRLRDVERWQGSYSKAVWAIVTPILGLLGLGIIYILLMAAAK